MAEKYASAQFGRCARVFCLGQPVLPVGRSDLPRNYTVNVFCPMCQVLEASGGGVIKKEGSGYHPLISSAR